jgi:short-subunit dehydrogenase
MSKVILITGASSGMGKETALKLIKEGHKVYPVARRIENMKDLEQLGAFPIQMDVTNEAELQNVVDIIIQKEGKIDVLWNNAGYALYGSVEETPIAEARRQFEVNLFGLASLTQKVIPHMRKSKKGLIINTSSVGGRIYTPLGAWYHATKHALEGWSDCLRLELKPFNIDVVILQPGAIATELAEVGKNPLIAISGNGPYKKLTNDIVQLTEKFYSRSDHSLVIADAISKIILAKKPKTRYKVGKLSSTSIFLRNNMGDRIFDKIVMSQLK